MKKRIVILIFILIFNIFLVSCDIKHKHFYIKGLCFCGEKELFSLKDNYEEKIILAKDIFDSKFPQENAEFRLIEIDEISESDYIWWYENYGEGVTRSILVEYSNGLLLWYAIEYETIEQAENTFKKLNSNSIYLYKNCLFAEAPGIMEYIYDATILGGCKYVNEEKILISAYTYKKLSLLSSVERIETCALMNLYYLEYVVCNENLKYIGGAALAGTVNLKKIQLNSKLEYIGSEAFYNSGLEYIVIPKSVKEIGNETFNKCNVFCEVESKPSGWADDFITGDAKVYYKGEWEYNEEGIPVPLV